MSNFEKYWEENASKESWANKAVAWNIWKEKQTIINDLKAQLECCRKENAVLLGKVGELKAQLENMEACYIEKKKQVEECAALAAGWNEIAWDKTTHWTEGYEEGCYHCSAQIEEALRGNHD